MSNSINYQKEIAELKKLARDPALAQDSRRLRENRHDPFTVNGQVDLDRPLLFLNEYNEFVNHEPKPFRPIIDKIIKL